MVVYSFLELLNPVSSQSVALNHHLQAIVFRRVMAARNHHAGATISMLDDKIQYGGGYHPYIQDIAAGGHNTIR